jgi:hypothetical protein
MILVYESSDDRFRSKILTIGIIEKRDTGSTPVGNFNTSEVMQRNNHKNKSPGRHVAGSLATDVYQRRPAI